MKELVDEMVSFPLGAAWEGAEAELPEGWRLMLSSHPHADDPQNRYEARAQPIVSDWSRGTPPDPVRVWRGDPAAALIALADRLATKIEKSAKP